MKAPWRVLVAAVIAALAVLSAGASISFARPHTSTSVRVPNVTGRYLNVAERRLIAAHLIPIEKGGGIFGIVVKADWQVCFQSPRAGKLVRAGSRVTVFVSRPGNC
jgi:beta-lactam-binding protein with PASTA domain